MANRPIRYAAARSESIERPTSVRLAGGPPVKPSQRQGFGTRVVNRVIQDLKGKLRVDWNPEGIACEITMPVD